MASFEETRRRFLKICGGVTCALGTGCGDEANGPASFGDVSGGNISDLPVGALRSIGAAPAFLARDALGVYALTSTCTHKGCSVDAQGSGDAAQLVCPCHGSRFDRNGAVVNGPAGAPLAHFAVEIDAQGSITVHGGMQVDEATRVKA